MDKIADILSSSGVVVIPTDTIYGIVGSALNPQIVEKIYKLRKRNLLKPMIILISSLDDLEKFEIKISLSQKEFLKKNWPNPLSVVLECNSKKFSYLHRGTNSLAFRMPKDENLLNLLKKTGPLVAPSANLEGEKPSESIDQAREYFGKEVDLYIDGGIIKASSSTLIKLNKGGEAIVLRKGSFPL